MTLFAALVRTMGRWNWSFQRFNPGCFLFITCNVNWSWVILILFNCLELIRQSLIIFGLIVKINACNIWGFGFSKFILPKLSTSRLNIKYLRFKFFLKFCDSQSINMLLDKFSLLFFNYRITFTATFCPIIFTFT